MESTALTDVFLPAALVVIMFGLGLTLTAEDFRRVAQHPVAVLAGLICQLVVVPAWAWFLASRADIDPRLAVGVVIIASCPGGAVSNLVTHLARADVALAVTLTAVSSLVTVITLPLVVNFAMANMLSDGASPVALPLAGTATRLFLLTVVPVVAGMELRKRRTALAAAIEPHVRHISALFLGVIIVVAIAAERGALPRYATVLLPILVALNAGALLIGFSAGTMARLPRAQRITLAIESGIHNGALGIAIPATFIGDAEMAIAPAIYGVLMLITGALVAVVAQRFNRA
jgi:BASS family bile acid:Na+ symporter